MKKTINFALFAADLPPEKWRLPPRSPFISLRLMHRQLFMRPLKTPEIV
jgi:hypothetical protein